MRDEKMKDVISNLFRGIAMGSADIIPGVSGGTIALITGIYARLIGAIRGIFSMIETGESISLITGDNARRKKIFKKSDPSLIFPLLTGIFIAVFLLSNLIVHLVENFEIGTYSFFIGLVVASSILLAFQSGLDKMYRVLIMAIGIAIGALLAGMPATFQFTGWAILFISGAVAITAMILPGISGSLVILMLGQYERVLQAVKDISILEILIFISGCIVGLGAFSNLLSRLMRDHEKSTKAFLVGLMLGSLRYQWDIISTAGIEEPLKAATSLMFITIGIMVIMLIGYLSRAHHEKQEA
ncbi:MAG: DUF368 domain-containing protein [Candidatus Woesearchaeota archaeon]